MVDLKKLYTRLCTFSVFCGVFNKTLFKKFREYIKESGTDEKAKKYGELVANIYKHGANLTEYVKRIAFEDENVYVKAVSAKKSINKNIESAVQFELGVLGEFASLTSEDFANDMDYSDTLPTFDSQRIDLLSEYNTRLKSIEKYGYGIFTANCMFSVTDTGAVVPVATADETSLDNFIGYKEERQRVIDNTVSFLQGKSNVNILLYGDAGTGKSSTVKAVANHFFDEGLRLVEIRKNQNPFCLKSH